jgi:multidrug resistance efflux pump
LFRIDAEPFRIAVEQAEAKLAAVGQTLGASTASVATAEAALAEATAGAANVREQARRVLELVNRGVYAAARADQASAQVKEAEASVQQAASELERARQNLGPRGQDNPQLREAMAVLQQARLNLVRTQIHAPADGVVTNLQLTVGQYASAGQAIMTFIDLGDYWVSAAFRENSLGRVAPGDRAEIVFDALPGHTFPAVVDNIGWGVARSGQTGPGGEMPTISNEKGWIRDPQRFPVRLTVATAAVPKGIRYNSQANVIVYADDNPVTQAIGWLWIRLVSILTYAI